MRQDPHITLFGFPIRFELFFWIVMALGAISYQTKLSFMLIYCFVFAFSILVHELGHAFMYRRYGSTARISLHGLGGATFGSAQPARQAIAVGAAGSLAQIILLALPAYFLRELLPLGAPVELHFFLYRLYWVSLFWGVLNLLPIWPLDGGHILENILILRTGKVMRKEVHAVSIVAVFAGLIIGGAYGYSIGWFLPLALIAGNGYFLYKIQQDQMTPDTSMIVSFNPRLDGDGGYVPDIPTRTATKQKRRGRKKDHLQVVAPVALSGPEAIEAAYDALEAGDKRSARGRVRDIAAKTTDREVAAAAREVLAWSWLRDGEPTRARQQLDASMTHSAALDAGFTFGSGSFADGVRAMAAALAQEENMRVVFQGSALVCEKGFGAKLADALLALPDGFGAAMQLHGVMLAVGARDDATALMNRLMG